LLPLSPVELRCKVFRALGASELEESVNRFLGDELRAQGEVQFEEITQSEGPGGVTLVVWYSLVEEEAGLEELEGGDELDDLRAGGKELA
jgi:hypothetical protein